MYEQGKLTETRVAIMGSGYTPMIFRFGTRYTDVFLAFCIFDTKPFSVYILARAASLLIPLSLSVLERKIAPRLRSLAGIENQMMFRSAAARVNLSYMMVCGALILMAMCAARFLAHDSGPDGTAFAGVLLWFVIGQSAPVVFGATGLLMRVVDRGVFCDLLQGLMAVFFSISIAVIGAKDPQDVAQILAVAQLTHAAYCALLLTKCGVWPGITALFHKEIKIF
ncbi:hypothetical protein [Sulfitobacter guttiformis]|uniref:Uncharacterized protein n=1 Tax=Sulfitobacter guttiformis TaxID=74349 RepID=A0A420DSA9_9RHOB|nr:hypothetical protein [Sulfitobacter guttiformis]KIN74587.1 hypothetical protein Z949_3786 [Sulfitobacter guttiformis KCTC 32187]RKE97166.1 hypothetical protein C8N30_1760 [Sulfitobacter guttiformis]